MKIDWYRAYHDYPYNAKWAMVAAMTGRPRCEIIAVWDCVINEASKAPDRGSVASIGPATHEAIAKALDMDPAHVKAIIDAMTKIPRPAIANGRLVGWEEHQPGRAMTPAERMRKYRERQRAEGAVRKPGRPAKSAPAKADPVAEDGNPTAAAERPKIRPKEDYAFYGRVIRLLPEDYEGWKAAYPLIDLTGLLRSRDDWLATQPDESARKDWFRRTSTYLAKKNSEAKQRADDEFSPRPTRDPANANFYG